MVYRAPEPLRCIDCPAHPVLEAVEGEVCVVCPSCGSAWFDEQLLMQWLHDRHPRRRIPEILDHDDGSPRRDCPRCGEPMEIAWMDFVQMDRCPSHGVWLDAADLLRLAHWRVGPLGLVMGPDPRKGRGKLT